MANHAGRRFNLGDYLRGERTCSRGAHARMGKRRELSLELSRGGAESGGSAASEPPAVAVLYDAENVSARHFHSVLEVANEDGRVNVLRVYGPAPLLSSVAWEDVARQYGVERVLCDGFKAGKNSADIRMAVDAVDLAVESRADSFVIVSGDTDFVPVVHRLQKARKRVHGIAPADRCAAFRGVFDDFTVLRNGKAAVHSVARASAKTGVDEATIELIAECAREANLPNGWCSVHELCQRIRLRRPGFRAKSYGFKTTIKLLKETDLFDVDKRGSENYVRLHDR